MTEKYIKECFEQIKAPDNAVDDAIRKALSAQHSNQKITTFSPGVKVKKRVITSLLAACLVIVFASGIVLGFNRDNPEPAQPDDNTFVVTANASQLGDKVDDTVVGAFSCESGGGWAMYSNLEYKLYPDSPNYFTAYALSDLNILTPSGVKEKTIDKVTFSIDNEGVYFALAPGGHYSFYYGEKEKSEQAKALEYFGEYSTLDNSRYTSDELVNYQDGLSKGWIYCDSFTYYNKDMKDKIDLDNCIEIISESNHDNPEILQKLEELWSCEQEIARIKASYSGNSSGKTTDRHNELYTRITVRSDEIQEKVFDGARIKVSVTYTDGITSVRYLNLSIEPVENEDISYKWLFIR